MKKRSVNKKLVKTPQKKIYRIQFGGRGAECVIHKLTTQQRQALVKGNVENNEMGFEEISKVLKMPVMAAGVCVTGMYVSPKYASVQLLDEDFNLLRNLQGKWKPRFFDEKKDLKRVFTLKNRYLICENEMKGQFQGFILRTKAPFNPQKLTTVITDVGNKVQLITGCRYDGKLLRLAPDGWGDDWGKGTYFHLT